MDIPALLEPFLEHPLAPSQFEQISMYIDLLLRWNARINLTAIREPEEIITRHFGESFFMARHLFPLRTEASLASASGTAHGQTFHARPRVIDLGSGAGFPALPLKIWMPALHSLLIESNHKKVTFLREVVRMLRLTDVDIIAERAEAVSPRLGPGVPPTDVVTFRAIEKFEEMLPLAASFLSPGSRLALLISEAQLPKLSTTLPTLSYQAVPVPKSHSRVLAICVLR